MQTQTIRRMITDAVNHEANTGTLSGLVAQFAQSQGLQPSAADIAGVVKLIQEYVEHAPAFLEAAATAAEQAGITGQVMPILEVAEQYFLSPVDVIPDHLGLVGLMDDAYLVHCLIQGISELYQQQTGNPLLPIDTTALNRFMRGLIGEPGASVLDTAVAGTLGMPNIQQALQQLVTNYGPTMSMEGPDPIWGNASIDEIVDARLGAMGVV